MIYIHLVYFNGSHHDHHIMIVGNVCHEKTNILVSDLVRHKPDCTATGDG